jgi:hypothetical protein
MSEIRVGTSAFTTAGWEGAFYPADMKPADYLTYYATKFDTVEVDSHVLSCAIGCDRYGLGVRDSG